ncbi:MAG: hypothetical protein ACK58T_15245, partial [Phycisphaerae bacterium]
MFSFLSLAMCSSFIMRLGFYEIREVNIANQCYLRVENKVAAPAPRRDYLLANSGEFVVLNTFEAKDDGPKNGVRLFMFFPRQSKVSVSGSSNILALSTTNPDVRFKIVADGIGLTGLNGVEVSEDPNITPGNQGGIELAVTTGLILDSGFNFAKDPRLDPQGSSTFKDSNNSSCAVQNSDIFNYPSE